ncbi:MAG: sporulation protein YqfD [Oscillospiraceae bacterium]|nr:sporulation protein YqfD [Oscillospiraceae bacterium]
MDWNDMNGTLTVEIVSASTADMMTAVVNAGVRLRDVYEVDLLTVRACVAREEYHQLKRILKKRGESCKQIAKTGVYWKLRHWLHRPVLVTGFLILFFASLYLPTRVLFVQVEGNDTVPAHQILEKAETCGIRMWASRAEVRSEKMKNRLLMSIPQLKWAGINTKGCTAVISVIERQTAPEEIHTAAPKRIVAARDGVVEDITVTKGFPLCKVGQAVAKGQVLVSPYTDCGISIKITDVEAEIMAVTSREVCVKTMFPTVLKGEINEEVLSVSIVIGKNKIKLCKGSGNCSGVCDKIYTENYLKLPGGFHLPVGIITERTLCRETESRDMFWQADDSLVQSLAEGYLNNEMVCGRILSKNTKVHYGPNGLLMEGKYSCLEMIGKLQDEEIVLYEQRG